MTEGRERATLTGTWDLVGYYTRSPPAPPLFIDGTSVPSLPPFLPHPVPSPLPLPLPLMDASVPLRRRPRSRTSCNQNYVHAGPCHSGIRARCRKVYTDVNSIDICIESIAKRPSLPITVSFEHGEQEVADIKRKRSPKKRFINSLPIIKCLFGKNLVDSLRSPNISQYSRDIDLTIARTDLKVKAVQCSRGTSPSFDVLWVSTSLIVTRYTHSAFRTRGSIATCILLPRIACECIDWLSRDAGYGICCNAQIGWH